jgi:CTD small phosphatase-like protein 2
LPPLRDIYKLPKHADDISDVYTLVLDLDETLIHYEPDDDEENEDGGYYNIRPGAIRFLSTLSEYFEVIVFTAAMPDVS